MTTIAGLSAGTGAIRMAQEVPLAEQQLRAAAGLRARSRKQWADGVHGHESGGTSGMLF